MLSGNLYKRANMSLAHGRLQVAGVQFAIAGLLCWLNRDDGPLGRCLMKLGHVAMRMARPQRALRLYLRAHRHLDFGVDPTWASRLHYFEAQAAALDGNRGLAIATLDMQLPLLQANGDALYELENRELHKALLAA